MELQLDDEAPSVRVGEARDERLIGSSRAMAALLAGLALASRSDATVLVTGETGTGKNAVARRIHRDSPRRRSPFVHVDCACLSASLVESELFGHERGAFTGALARRVGRFERAANGTIFLDEIGELEPRLQAKLLRVLEEREFEALGGNQTRRMRARVVAATSRDLESEVARGRFRADLFYRLHILRLHVPPLRERKEDIAALAAEGARRAARLLRSEPPALSREFIDALGVHDWPGNVRELLNLVEAAIVRSPQLPPVGAVVPDLIARRPSGGARASAWRSGSRAGWPPSADDLSAARSMARAGVSESSDRAFAPSARASRECPANPERARIAELLVASGGNVARVARQLGLPRSTLRYRIQRFGLSGLVPRD